MSKYIYTTIYEQFTGLKPPEPKDRKPRRRRGYGHPYRMRLSMQDEASNQPNEMMQPSSNELDHLAPPRVTTFQPSIKKQSVHHFNAPNSHQQRREKPHFTTHNSMVEEVTPHHNSEKEPTVIYKKRRSYQSPTVSLNKLSRDSGDFDY